MRGRRTWIVIAALAAWLVAGTGLGGILMIRHLVALPVPDASDLTLSRAIRAELPRPGWRTVHFMYRSCPCSQRTIAHLLGAPRPPALQELVVMVDDTGGAAAEDAQLRAAGFAVEVITPTVLQTRFHLEAAPVLVVMTPEGRVAYIGGYNRHKQSRDYEDVAIIASLRADHAAGALPVFGCPTSQRLAGLVDPLSLARR